MPLSATEIAANLETVRARIQRACLAAGRTSDEVTLLAVSKTFPASAIRAAYAAGQRDFGESYVQDWHEKRDQLTDLACICHFIGPLQSNKTREVAESFDWVHSVDRLKIARRLSDQRPADLPPLNICLQVNISGEASKSGCTPQELPALAQAVASLPRLKLRGLMAVPAPASGGTDPRLAFRQLRTLQTELQRTGLALDTLSAGMSDDLEAAIAEGSTIVRVGTAIFGHRG
ncbi:YggS family pyridoxal phosphate-dependent enzyme [Sinimarinibacterium sp. CAU 1509]|uniref:YggS family pyridoxal phosphate-dependent enzyme n=1 Tax=Sinimarinibacterium sp. CAU 1509 TaxID=2562283 RepID=UPI0010AD5DA6|nr:YggS family pyridoxal phosphate-dependent enzyme [Sinimarinibacterium sp. CAU 1509]TJY56681.1 YggS family pyridoxal phosphate-dependent enzyme [Sinimarinibacterium sp. CAU 1509]